MGDETCRWTTVLDFAVIAKANVVAHVVTCSPDHSVDIQTLITKRLKKIEELLDSTGLTRATPQWARRVRRLSWPL